MNPSLRLLGRHIVLVMTWLFFSRLGAFINWLWRNSCLVLMRLVHVTRYLPPGRREESGSPDEPESTEENKPAASASPEERPEPAWEGQHEAATRDRDADCARGSEEDEEDEDDEDEFDKEQYRVESTDELYCDYDSTWEAEEPPERTPRRNRRPVAGRYYKFHRFETAAKDMQNYRHDYPAQINPQRWSYRVSSDDKLNLRFYLGEIPSMPDGVYIDNFHDEWNGDYATLEHAHAYIQWLFPLQEPGMNSEASTLTKEEIKDFLQSNIAQNNLLKSYELMLDFYGIRLCDKKTGEVTKASNWKNRFHNLNSHTHNSLRITRILKCLGNLGYPHYQAPLVHFFLKETLVHGELPNIRDSVLNYFVFAVLDKKQRRNLLKFAYLSYYPKDEFVWCPKKIQMMWLGLTVSKPRKGMKGKKDQRELDPRSESESPEKEGEPKKKQIKLSKMNLYPTSDNSADSQSPEPDGSFHLLNEMSPKHEEAVAGSQPD